MGTDDRLESSRRCVLIWIQKLNLCFIISFWIVLIPWKETGTILTPTFVVSNQWAGGGAVGVIVGNSINFILPIPRFSNFPRYSVEYCWAKLGNPVDTIFQFVMVRWLNNYLVATLPKVMGKYKKQWNSLWKSFKNFSSFPNFSVKYCLILLYPNEYELKQRPFFSKFSVLRIDNFSYFMF